MMAVLGGKAQAERAQALAERQMVLLVPPPALLERFLQNEPERLMQRVVHRDRGGVMVDAFLAPVTGEEIDVEIPTLDRRFAPCRDLQRARAERHRGQTGRTAQAFLRARVSCI